MCRLCPEKSPPSGVPIAIGIGVKMREIEPLKNLHRGSQRRHRGAQRRRHVFEYHKAINRVI